jgi:hypothetical protein
MSYFGRTLGHESRISNPVRNVYESCLVGRLHGSDPHMVRVASGQSADNPIVRSEAAFFSRYRLISVAVATPVRLRALTFVIRPNLRVGRFPST